MVCPTRALLLRFVGAHLSSVDPHRLDTVNARAEAVLARTGLLNTLALPLSAQERKQAAASARGSASSSGAVVPHLHLPRPTPRSGAATSSSRVPAWALQPAHAARHGGGSSKGRAGAVGGALAASTGALLPAPHGAQAGQHRRGSVLPGVRVCVTFGVRINGNGELCFKPESFTASAGALHTQTATLPPWVAPLTAGAQGAFTWVTRACSNVATGIGRTLLGALQDALSDNVGDGAPAKRVDGPAASVARVAHGSEQGVAAQRGAVAEQVDEEVTSAPSAPRERPRAAPPTVAWSPASAVSDDTSLITDDSFPPPGPPLAPQPRNSAPGASNDDESAAAAAHALVASLLAGTSDDLATLEFSAANRRAARSHLGSGGLAATPSSASSVFINGSGMQTPGETPMGPGMAALVSAMGGTYGATSSEDALREAARIELGRMRQEGGDESGRMGAEQAWAHEADMVPTPEGTPMAPHHLSVEEQREIWLHNREAAVHAAARRYSGGGGDAHGGGGPSPSSPSYGRTSVLHIR